MRLPLVAEAEQDVALSVSRSSIARSARPRSGPCTAGDRGEISRTVGSVVYGAMTSRSPSRPRARCYDWATWGRYDKPRRDYDELVIAVDTAMETGEAHDYTACVVLGRWEHRIDVLHVDRAKLPFVEQLMMVRELTRVYRGAHVVVEAANAGVALSSRGTPP